MDRRLFKDYLRRWWWLYAFILLCLALMAVGEYEGKPNPSRWIGMILPCIVLMRLVDSEMVRGDAIRVLCTLPLPGRTLVGTLWTIIVAIPVLMTGIVHLAGLVLLRIVKWPETVPWQPFVQTSCLFAAAAGSLFLCCGFDTVLKSRKEHRNVSVLIGTIHSSIWFFLVAVLLVARPGSPYASLVIIPSSLLLFVGSYVASRYLSSSLLLGRRRDEGSAAPKWGRSLERLSINWFDAALSNPFSSAVVASFALILFTYFLTVIHNFLHQNVPIWNPIPNLTKPVSLYMVPLVLFVMSIGWLSSIRAFAHLPISKWKMVFSQLAFLVIGVVPVTGLCIMIVQLTVPEPAAPTLLLFAGCLIAIGGVLIGNGVFMRWGYLPAMAAIWGVLMVLFFGGTTKDFGLYKSPTGLQLGIVFGLALIVAGSIWIWWLLRNSSAPYRNKTSLFLPMGSRR